MNKYDIIKTNLKVLSAMAASFTISAFVLCSLPWGSYGWMGRLNFLKLSPEEARKSFIEHRLEKDIKMEIFGKTCKVDAGTNIQIQGWYVRLPEMEGETKAWLIQTEDGRRGLCNPQELNDVIKEHTIAVYDHARQDDDWLYFHTIVFKEEMDELISKHISFKTFDSIYGPAINAAPDIKTGRYIASYRGLDIRFDKSLKEGVIAKFTDNRLDSVYNYSRYDVWCFKWLAPYASNWMKHSVAYISPGYYKLPKGYGPLRSSFYPYKWLARGIMGVIDVLFAYFVLIIASTIVFFLLLENKKISNTFINMSIIVICGIIYTLYVYYTMELSPNLFCFGVSSLILLSICLSLISRCPQCRSLVSMETIDITYGTIQEKVYDTYSIKDKKVDEWEGYLSEGTVVDREHIKTRLIEKSRKVTKRYRCPICGYTSTSTNNQIVDSKRIREITGVDRITTTKTWTNNYF